MRQSGVDKKIAPAEAEYTLAVRVKITGF